VFEAGLEGLIVAELEFVSEEAAGRLDPPAWAERELTEDVRFTNRSLAVDGLPSEATDDPDEAIAEP
jgi:adenylate cyclase